MPSTLEESPATFRATKEFHDWLNQIVGSMDGPSKSKIIRASIRLSIYTLKANPGLIDILDHDPIFPKGDQ
jgi:hypothetical protein